MELAEEARNVKVESGRSCFTEEVQSQGARLTRPVFVTVMEYSMPVLKKGVTIAACITTNMIQTSFFCWKARSSRPVGIVGLQNKTEQSVLPDSDADEVGTVPVGQYITRRPVGTNGMFSSSDSDQPTADLSISF